MTIRIFTDIDDPVLVKAWEDIVDEYHYFAQSSHGWCAPWWRRLSRGRVLHVVTVLDTAGEIKGIAPMCLERLVVGRVLRSFPVHFADFFTLLVKKDGDEEETRAELLRYMQSFASWDLVRIDQINSEDPCYPLLLDYQYRVKKLTDIMIANIDVATFDDYLQTLSAQRKKILSKKRRLEREHGVYLERINTYAGYEWALEEIKEVYEKRWAGKGGIKLSDNYYACRNQAVKACFAKKQMVLFLLRNSEVVVAYVLGFLDAAAFYTWKVSHDPQFNRYSPGVVIRYAVLENLIGEVSFVNFMAGGYGYKRSLAKGGKVVENGVFFAAGPSLKGQLLLLYYLRWRDHFRSMYQWLRGARSTVLMFATRGRKSQYAAN